jgi:hypothetical protein
MAYQLGSRNKTTKSYESDATSMVFHFRKTSHPELLDVELDASDFAEKWNRLQDQKKPLFDELREQLEEDEEGVSFEDLFFRMDEETRADWNERFSALKSEMRSSDVEPVFDFIADHLTKIGGLLDEDGETLEEPLPWGDIDPADQEGILGSIPPYEVAELFYEIKQTIALTADQKNV